MLQRLKVSEPTATLTPPSALLPRVPKDRVARNVGGVLGGRIAGRGTVRAALWMAGAVLSVTATALSVRALSKSLDPFDIMLVRSGGGLLLLLGLIAIRPQLRHGLATRRLGLHLVRN